ncbi:MAG TPA: ABC transporter permease subunit [Conexibacter sp.]|nr:ABC transporter permease subunit [Conexibacter sp.]
MSDVALETPAATARPRSVAPAVARTAWRLAAIGVLLIAWAIGSRVSDLVPGVVESFTAIADAARDGTLWPALKATLRASFTAFGVAFAIAIALGTLLGLSRFWGAVLDPFVMAMFAIPRFIVYPVLLAAFGVGITSKVAIGVLSALFPILLNVTAGLRAVNPVLVKLSRSLACGPLQRLRMIYYPAALPAIMVGARLGFSVAFMVVVLAELFAATDGLGLIVQSAYSGQRYAEMFGVVVLITTIAFLGNYVLWRLELLVRSSVDAPVPPP